MFLWTDSQSFMQNGATTIIIRLDCDVLHHMLAAAFASANANSCFSFS
jgi:hypothetical protein